MNAGKESCTNTFSSYLLVFFFLGEPLQGYILEPNRRLVLGRSGALHPQRSNSGIDGRSGVLPGFHNRRGALPTPPSHHR